MYFGLILHVRRLKRRGYKKVVRRPGRAAKFQKFSQSYLENMGIKG